MSAEMLKILCVDDEPRVLSGLERHLRKRFEVLTAPGGAEALDVMAQNKDLAIVISDMRMPEMDGATFLRHARVTNPNCVRILLTGQADLTAAIKAINEGQIFRFLVKPCPPDMLSTVMDEAQRQYELITAEKELLQRTLVGAVKALVDVMTFAIPDAMGRASRIKRRASLIAREIHVEQKWQVEIAALLSQVSALSLPPELAHKLADGEDLDEAEHSQARAARVAANAVIAQIPRLEAVAHLLDHATGMSAESVTDAALRRRIGLLKLVMELDRVESKGVSISTALEHARASGSHESDLLEATARAIAHAAEVMVPAIVKIIELRPGMVVDEDISTRRGVLIAPRGCEVTLSFLEHIRQFSYELDVSTVAVLEPRKQL
jgi:response regulator RpfG family c-di-GMP phosphodiesterase